MGLTQEFTPTLNQLALSQQFSCTVQELVHGGTIFSCVFERQSV